MVADDEAERELERATAAVAVFDLDGAVANLSAAIRQFTASGERRRAAMSCVRLGDLFANYMGNLTAGRVWFARASRLVEGEEPCVEQGWVAVAGLGCDVDDPAVLLARSEFDLGRPDRVGIGLRPAGHREEPGPLLHPGHHQRRGPFSAHGLIQRIPHTNRYQVTASPGAIR
ncbi:MAG: hypothetical protein M3R01_14935 [Actinomycetota bacterium]|nr:hypothetical protein [Actinomycetota bacterium]